MKTIIAILPRRSLTTATLAQAQRLLRPVYRCRGATLERRLARDSRGRRLRGHQLAGARSRSGTGQPRRATAHVVELGRATSPPRFEQVDWDNFSNGITRTSSRSARASASSSNSRGRSRATDRSRPTMPRRWRPSGRTFARPLASRTSTGRRKGSPGRPAPRTRGGFSRRTGARRGANRASRTSIGTRSSTIAICSRVATPAVSARRRRRTRSRARKPRS